MKELLGGAHHTKMMLIKDIEAVPSAKCIILRKDSFVNKIFHMDIFLCGLVYVGGKSICIIEHKRGNIDIVCKVKTERLNDVSK